MAGYVRQASAEIQPDLVILAQSFNKEFNALADSFSTNGHSHDGTLGNGPRINLLTSVQNYLSVENGGTGARTKEEARENLGLIIGEEIQGFSPFLKEISAFTTENVGVLAKDSSGKFFTRTLTGTAKAIEITYGSGASNNPIFNLAKDLDFTDKTVSKGTFKDNTFTGGSFSGNGAGITNIQASNIVGLETDFSKKMNISGGTFTGVVSFGEGANFQKGLTLGAGQNARAPAAPVNGEHLTNKTYVDGLVTSSSAADRARANHTGTQPISTIVGLQDALDSKTNSSGTTFSGNVSIGGNRVTNLATAVEPLDAVNLALMKLFMPTGMIIPYAGINTTGLGNHWLLLDGRAVSRTTYADLFAICGIRFGPGNGTSTFNIPDLRGRVIAGLDNMGGANANRLTSSGGAGFPTTTSGNSGGSQSVALTVAQLPSHAHGGIPTTAVVPVTDWGVTGSYPGRITKGRLIVGSGDNERHEVLESLLAAGNNKSVSLTGARASQNQGGGAGHSNVQPTMVLNYIIKT